MYIGIDIGGTNVRVAGSKNLENVALDKVNKFELSHNFEADLGNIIEIIRELSDGKVEAIGIGTPGTYNEDKSLLISGKNVLEWVNMPFVEMLSQEFDCPVFADNDAVVASLGEAFYGQGRNKNFIYVTWGTGIGGASVKADSKVFAEKIDWKLHFEAFNSKCGGLEISERYNKSANELSNDDWKQIMEDFEFYLSEISNKLNERNIILGGGAAAKQKERLQRVADNLRKKGINLYCSNLGDDSGLYGAMALIKINKK